MTIYPPASIRVKIANHRTRRKVIMAVSLCERVASHEQVDTQKLSFSFQLIVIIYLRVNYSKLLTKFAANQGVFMEQRNMDDTL